MLSMINFPIVAKPFAKGSKAVQRLARSKLKESFRFDILHVSEKDCFFIKSKNFHHSEDIFANAFSTSAKPTTQSVTICRAAHSLTQYIFASSASKGTHASVNCLNSVPYNFHAERTCQ